MVASRLWLRGVNRPEMERAKRCRPKRLQRIEYRQSAVGILQDQRARRNAEHGAERAILGGNLHLFRKRKIRRNVGPQEKRKATILRKFVRIANPDGRSRRRLLQVLAH